MSLVLRTCWQNISTIGRYSCVHRQSAHFSLALRTIRPRTLPVYRYFSSGPPRPSAADSAQATSVEIENSGLNLRCATQSGIVVCFFHSAWLWQNAPTSRHADSGQLTVDPASVKLHDALAAVTLSNDAQSLEVTWTSGERAQFSISWLLERRHGAADLRGAAARAQPPALGYPAPAHGVGARASISGIRPSASSAAASCVVAATAGSSGSTALGRDAIAQFPFADIVSSEAAMHAWLQAVNRDGIALVTGAPKDAGTVLQVARRIAAPQLTIYGESWDVAVEARPINIAYAPVALDLHVDLVYYESPPGLQLLHCRAFDADVVGGESTFIDGFAAARAFARLFPQHFLALATLPTTFQKVHYRRSQPAHIVMERPVFALNRYHMAMDARAAGTTAGTSAAEGRVGGAGPTSGLSFAGSAAAQPWSLEAAAAAASPDGSLAPYVTGIFWAPPFEGPLRLAPEDLPRYYAAYDEFVAFLRSRDPAAAASDAAAASTGAGGTPATPSSAVAHAAGPAAGSSARTLDQAAADAAGAPPFLEFRMQEGDVSVFNNRRMLHGRRTFHARKTAAADAGGASAAMADAPVPQRVLQGCYVNIDEFKSRLLALCSEHGGADEVKLVGNQNWY